MNLVNHSDLMPSIGFGTYLINNKEIEHVVDRALNIGYRHIDTAEVYRNEKGIGTALQNSLPGLSIKREDIFITSKVFPGNPSWGREAKDYKATVKACEDSLSRLKLEFLDLYLIHAPFTSEHRLGQWEALCDLKKAGKVKSIGVSNFNNKHIEEITNSGLETPEVNQIELHPWCQKEKLVSFLNQKNIKIVAYSSLVPLLNWRNIPDQDSSKSDEMKKDGEADRSHFNTLAVKYEVSEAQILLKWGLQKGFVILPKSINEERMKENLNLDFEIEQLDMITIGNMDRGDGVAWPSGDPCNSD